MTHGENIQRRQNIIQACIDDVLPGKLEVHYDKLSEAFHLFLARPRLGVGYLATIDLHWHPIDDLGSYCTEWFRSVRGNIAETNWDAELKTLIEEKP